MNLLIVGLIHTGVTYCMYFSSLKELPGQKAAILSYIDPLAAVLISVTILGETMTLWQVTGGILLFFGMKLQNETADLTVVKKGFLSYNEKQSNCLENYFQRRRDGKFTIKETHIGSC